MRGMIREKKGRDRYYELRVYAGKDPVTGRSRYVTEGFNGRTHRTPAAARKAAEQRLAKLIVEVDEERHSATEGSVGHLLTEWMAGVELEREQTTIKGYRSIVKQVIADDLGKVQLRHLTAKHLEDFYQKLRRAGRAGQTVRNYHTVLHRALDAAVRWGWVQFNVSDRIAIAGGKSKAITVPTVLEIRRLVGAGAESRNPMMGLIIQVAAATGARRGELCGLRWQDFHANDGTLLVEQAIAHGTVGLVRKGTKTHAARRFDLGKGTLAALEQRRVEAEEIHGGPVAASSFIFSHVPDSSEPVSPNGITQAFGRIASRIELGHLRFHDLRHHFATSLLSKGVDVGTVADLLGHADASVTLRVYRHFVPAAGNQAVAMMDELLYG